MNRNAYLLRIGVDPTGLAPDEQTLRLLQRQHLLSVPFENLDIHWNQPIVLDISRFYTKIVESKRGGFCYELNALFNELLRDIGFESRLVSARVSDGQGGFTDEYDHAAIIVTIDEAEFLADVGFGDFTAGPLRLTADIEQSDNAGVFMIRSRDGGYVEAVKKDGDAWQSEYIFEPIGRDLSEFTKRCDHQQFSPESHFRKGKVCSLLTETGRKTLTDKKFIVTSKGEKDERAVASDQEFERILMREFNIRRSN